VDSTDTTESPLFNWYILHINYVLGSTVGDNYEQDKWGLCLHTAHILWGTGRCFRNKLEAIKYELAIISMKKITRACDSKWVGWREVILIEVLQESVSVKGPFRLVSRGPTKCWDSYPSLSLPSLRYLIDHLQIKPTPCQNLIQIRSANTSWVIIEESVYPSYDWGQRRWDVNELGELIDPEMLFVTGVYWTCRRR